MEHLPPVTVSVLFSLPLHPSWSVESGISYTYLYSRFRKSDKFDYRASLKQHYFGVPLYVTCTLWRNPDWRLYLTGGGAIEKGVWMNYHQETLENGNIIDHGTLIKRIDGFQFSAMAGAGVHYRLNQRFGLFAEPRVVYYFDNHQPMSIHTENPFVFGLNIGLRMQFQK